MELIKTEQCSYTVFKDNNGEEYLLIKPSLDPKDVIYLGIHKPNPQLLVKGQGWRPYDLPEDVHVSTLMHLTQEQVKELLPHLQAFVETGEIEVQEKKSKKYIYNYCVEFLGRPTHASGCITRSTAIESDEDYLQVRECIKASMKEDLKVEIKNMVIISLTLLNP